MEGRAFVIWNPLNNDMKRLAGFTNAEAKGLRRPSSCHLDGPWPSASDCISILAAEDQKPLLKAAKAMYSRELISKELHQSTTSGEHPHKHTYLVRLDITFTLI